MVGFAGQWTIAMALLMTIPAVAGSGKTDKPKHAAEGAPVDASQYAGSDACKACHEESFKSFESTPHWKTTLKHGAEAQGCEACHGAGKAHIEGGGDKSKIFSFAGAEPGAISKRCLSCHEYGEEHANFGRSQHNVNSVSCVACHSAHHAKQAQFLLLQKQPELCYSCHTEIKQEFSRPFRHRVDQGLVQCTDCHTSTAAF